MKRLILKLVLFSCLLFNFSIFAANINYEQFISNLNRNSTKTVFAKIGNSSTNLSSERVKQIALSHARISERDARFTKIKLDRDNGILIYEIEFYSGNTKYEYGINANTGEILEFESERK